MLLALLILFRRRFLRLWLGDYWYGRVRRPCASGTARVHKAATVSLECIKAVRISADQNVHIHGSREGCKGAGIARRHDLVTMHNTNTQRWVMNQQGERETRVLRLLARRRERVESTHFIVVSTDDVDIVCERAQVVIGTAITDVARADDLFNFARHLLLSARRFTRRCTDQ